MYSVSDLMVTAHSTLRDRYQFRARFVDACLLIGGALVAAFTFVDQSVIKLLLPSRVPAPVVVGLAGIVVFIASLLQMKMDWNGRGALHARAVESYLSIKHQLGRIKCLPPGDREIEAIFAGIRERYEGIGSATIALPDRLFTRLKQIHRLKIEISKALDKQPGASIWLLRLKLWWRDNIRMSSHGPES